MSFRQQVTPPRLLGRVNGTLRVMCLMSEYFQP